MAASFPPHLVELGWGPEFAAALDALADPALRPARVAVEDKHAYFVVDGQAEWNALVPGRLLHQASRADLPKVGDWVALRVLDEPGRAVIEAVLPRRTRLVRKRAGREVEDQVLATNVDTAFVVLGLDDSFNLRRLERFLVMVHEGGAQSVVVLNKADVGEALADREAAAHEVAQAAPVVVTSAKSGLGLGKLRQFIRPGTTAVFLGSSGVGKSSLINRLYGEEIQATLEVRERDAKGRHTTSWREMIRLPRGGLVIDTPGMREFHTWMAAEGLEDAFPDLEALAVTCHFRGCTHTVEKRCALLAAVAGGTVPRERLAGYLKLKRESDFLARERRQHTFHGGRKSRTPRPRAPEEPWREL